MKFHIVKQGETLGSIAEQYGLSESKLSNMNKHLSDVTAVLEGMKVKVPQQVASKRVNNHQNQSSPTQSTERFPFPDHRKTRSIPVIREDEWFDKQLAPYTYHQSKPSYHHDNEGSYQPAQPMSVPYPYPHYYRENPYGYGWSNGCGCQ